MASPRCIFVLAAALGSALAVLGCHAHQQSPQSLPEMQGGAEIGLKRGSAWVTLTVKPPHFIGPDSTLKIQKNIVTGSIGGNGVNLRLERDAISGSGPGGTVAVDIESDPDVLEWAGTWNGSRVSFKYTPDSFRGTIPLRAGLTSLSVATCQYVLDKVEPDGARTGVSTCSGLPEETRLEIPAVVHGWLTRSELVVVLLALLSAPPYSSGENSSRVLHGPPPSGSELRGAR